MFGMKTIIYLLTLLFAPGFAYWDDLVDCLEGEQTDHPSVQKVINALRNCTAAMANQGKELTPNDTLCDTFVKQIDYDHCFNREMGWTNENETAVDYGQWGEDNENMSTIMEYKSEQNWEAFDDCFCETKKQVRQTGIVLMCPNDNHVAGHWFLSALARCTINGIRAACPIKD